MRKTTIAAAQTARKFADWVNRVQAHHPVFVPLKHGTPVARLVPAHEKICTGRDLARILGDIKLSAVESAAWQSDLKAARKSLNAQAHKW